jgi:hypothetical protein
LKFWLEDCPSVTVIAVLMVGAVRVAVLHGSVTVIVNWMNFSSKKFSQRPIALNSRVNEL